MIVTLGEDRLKPGKCPQFLEIDLVDLVERSADCSVDIEITAGEDSAGIQELLEDGERSFVQSRQRRLERLRGRVGETGAEQVETRDKPERSLNRSMTAIVLSNLIRRASPPLASQRSSASTASAHRWPSGEARMDGSRLARK